MELYFLALLPFGLLSAWLRRHQNHSSTAGVGFLAALAPVLAKGWDLFTKHKQGKSAAKQAAEQRKLEAVELPERAALCPARCPDPRARVERVEACPASFFRYLYAEVGRGHSWLERIRWTDEQVGARLGDPAVSLFLLTVAGAPAGYFELEKHHDGSVEVSYFGVLPEFQGRGLDKYLLTEAVEGRVGARRLAGVAPHLHPRPPGRAAQLPRPRLPALQDGDVRGEPARV